MPALYIATTIFKRLYFTPKGCPRIGLFSQVEVFPKNKHSLRFDIGAFLQSLTYEHYFFKITKSWVKMAFPDSLSSGQAKDETQPNLFPHPKKNALFPGRD